MFKRRLRRPGFRSDDSRRYAAAVGSFPLGSALKNCEADSFLSRSVPTGYPEKSLTMQNKTQHPIFSARRCSAYARRSPNPTAYRSFPIRPLGRTPFGFRANCPAFGPDAVRFSGRASPRTLPDTCLPSHKKRGRNRRFPSVFCGRAADSHKRKKETSSFLFHLSSPNIYSQPHYRSNASLIVFAVALLCVTANPASPDSAKHPEAFRRLARSAGFAYKAAVCCMQTGNKSRRR